MTGAQTVASLDDQYGKILAIVMRKYRLAHVQLTPEDIESAITAGMNLSVQELDGVLHIKLVTLEEAIRLQALEDKLNPPKNPQ